MRHLARLTELIPGARDLRDITKWPQETIEYMYEHPQQRCPCCINEVIPGQHTVKIKAGFFGTLMVMTRPCTHCDETGMISYICMN